MEQSVKVCVCALDVCPCRGDDFKDCEGKLNSKGLFLSFSFPGMFGLIHIYRSDSFCL